MRYRAAAAQSPVTRLILLGTAGGPRPQKARAASAQVIVSNNAAYVIDCGDGVARQLVLAGMPLPTLRHVFITHHHSDHTADYGNLIWLAWTAGLSTRVDTWGPPPLANMTKLFFEMNAYDIDARISNEGGCVRVHLEEQLRHLRKRRRSPACRRACSGPLSTPARSGCRSRRCDRMVMRDEDVTQRRERHSGQHQLTCNAVAAVDHVRGVVADDHLRRGRPRPLRPRSSCRSEENQPRDPRLRGRGSISHRARRGDRAQKRTTADDSHMRDPKDVRILTLWGVTADCGAETRRLRV